MTQLFERLHVLAARLERLGVSRTAQDLTGVAEHLRQAAITRSEIDSPLTDAIERMTMIHVRLKRARLETLAADVLVVLEALKDLR